MGQLNVTTAELQGILDANKSQYTMKINPVTGLRFRSGIRDNQFVVDKELNQTGFGGVEGVDWENIFATV